MILKMKHEKVTGHSQPYWAQVLVLSLIITGCAHHQTGQRKSNPHQDARLACERLSRTSLPLPIQTPIKAEWERIEEAQAARKRKTAAKLARALYRACADEADKRENLQPIVEIVEKDRALIDPIIYNQFKALVLSGDYAQASLCGEGILQKNPESCGFTSPYSRKAGSTVTLQAGDPAPLRSNTLTAPAKPTDAQPAPSSQSTLGSPAVTSSNALPRENEPDTTDNDFKPTDTTAKASASEVKDQSMSKKRMWSWILIGGGVGLLAGGGIMAGLAQAKYNELEETCPYCYQRDIDAGKRRAITADILFGAGGAALATGVALWIWDLRAKPKREKMSAMRPLLNISPNSVSISGRY